MGIARTLAEAKMRPSTHLRAVRRFMASFDEDESGCWIWNRTINWDGYGRFSVGEGLYLAHRWIYEHVHGPILPGLTIDHLCKQRRCVNPEHMRLASRGDNTLLGNGPTARNRRKTHCNHGHAFTEENTRIDPLGYRVCRTCNRLRWHRDEARRKAALAPDEGEEEERQPACPHARNPWIPCEECDLNGAVSVTNGQVSIPDKMPDEGEGG